MTALDRLTRSLLDLAARGERTHCSNATSHHLWLSEAVQYAGNVCPAVIGGLQLVRLGKGEVP